MAGLPLEKGEIFMSKLLKGFLLGIVTTFLVAGSAMAVPYAPTELFSDYEYYQLETTEYGYGNVGEHTEVGDSRYFDFDLLDTNSGSTDSQLALVQDVTNYGPSPATGIAKLWASITIFSLDVDADVYNFSITATIDDDVYQLGTSGLWPQSQENEQFGTMTIEFTDELLAAWRSDPTGRISLSVVNQDGNDFNLVEVGVGVSPVPEPAAMMLFGIGLLSLAGITRKKTQA